MQKNYHIGFNSRETPELLQVLKTQQIKFKDSKLTEDSSLITFDIFEGQDGWEFIEPFLDSVSKIVSLKYTSKEMNEAQWFRIYSTSRLGYPQPEDLWYSTHFTHKHYDVDSGIYSEQIKSFRIKSESKTKKTFMSLLWANELFVRKSVIKEIESAKITGWQTRPVIIHKTKQQSKTVCQFDIIKTLTIDGVMDNHTKYTTKSGYEKYIRDGGDPYQYTEALLDEKSDIVLSKEIFGDARIAAKAKLVSKKFYDLVIKNKWKGLHFEPVQIINL